MHVKENEEIGNYKVLRQLGKGSFGTVYEVENRIDKKIYAMKIENNQANREISQLRNEYKAYRDLSGCHGITNITYFGVYNDNYYLVMNRLGASLQNIFERRSKHFSIKTTCMIGIRVIDILEDLHSKKRLYRDMKPDNILTETIESDRLFIVDLGMSKFYIDPVSKLHIPLLTKKKLTGTARYASVNTHLGLEQSRRDDLECLGYVLIYFNRGSLLWMGINAPTGQEKYFLIGERKKDISNEELCKGLIGEKYLIEYFKYVKNLEFEETPDYKYLKMLFLKILEDENLRNDGVFDWIINRESFIRTPSREHRTRSRKRSIFDLIKSFFKKIKNFFES